MYRSAGDQTRGRGRNSRQATAPPDRPSLAPVPSDHHRLQPKEREREINRGENLLLLLEAAALLIRVVQLRVRVADFLRIDEQLEALCHAQLRVKQVSLVCEVRSVGVSNVAYFAAVLFRQRGEQERVIAEKCRLHA